MRVLDKLTRWTFVHLPWAARLWFPKARTHRGGPAFVEVTRPLSELTFGLVTTGGVHHASQPDFKRKQASPDGDGSWRIIDMESDDPLTITHDWYDHTDAEKDLNLVYPYQRMQELATEGVIAGVHARGVGVMGHVAGKEERKLEHQTAPEVADFFVKEGVDAVLLIPA